MITQRIYGPPGTGKTTEITRMATAAAEQYGGGGVLIASFTTAAAAEVGARAPDIPLDNIGTIHKFCYDAIGRPPVVEDKPAKIKEWNEYAPAYKMTAGGCKDINSGLEYGDCATLGDVLMGQATILRNRLIPTDQWPANLQAFYQLWRDWKRSSGSIDYTDMLEHALDEASCAPQRPQIIFVDEAQDCTALQFAVLKQWASHAQAFVMVGDDDQCIYEFAGATPEAFAPGQLTDNDRVLEESYRVPYAVWDHAMKWITKVTRRVDKTYMPRHSESPGFVKRAPFTHKQGKELVAMALKCAERYNSTMIIAPCSYMLTPAVAALRTAGVPFHNPYRLIRADWNPLKLAKGTTFPERVAAFLKPKLQPEGDRLWTANEIKIWAYHLKAEGNFNRGAKKLLDSDDIGNRSGADLLTDLFTEEALKHIIDVDLVWWAANLVNDDTKAKAQYALNVVEHFGAGFLDAREVPPPITVGTIHSVKGGEADCVILIPDLSQQSMIEWTGKGKDAIRRLLYVGMTRAREGLIICKPASNYTTDV